MKEINPRASEHLEYRQAVRELCSQFDSKYWMKVEEASAYPEEFVKAQAAAAVLRRNQCRQPAGFGQGLHKFFRIRGSFFHFHPVLAVELAA